MRKVILSLLLTVLLFPQEFRVVDEVLAIVGDEIITLSEVKAYEAQILKALATRYKGKELQAAFEEARKRILEDLINQKVLLNKAMEEGLKVDEELKIVLQNMAKEYGFSTPEDLIKEMRKEGIDFEQWKEQAKKTLLQQKLIQREVESKISITEGQIRTYYEEHIKEFTEPAKLILKAIFISKADKSEDEIENLKRKVDQALKERKFSEVASEFSDEPLRSKKGDLGEMEEAHLSEPLRKALKTVKEGEVSSWVETENGWYRLLVVKRFPAKVKPLSQVRQQIHQLLFQKERERLLKEYIERIKKKTYIKILRKYPG